MTSDSWLKLQAGKSEGLVSGTMQSDDGGYEFLRPATRRSFVDADAGAYRADVNVGFGDFFDGRRERLNLYAQSLDAGYSAPGQSTAQGHGVLRRQRSRCR